MLEVQGIELKKHGNKVRITTQKKTNLIQKDGGEEKQEEYTLHLFYLPSCGTDVGFSSSFSFPPSF